MRSALLLACCLISSSISTRTQYYQQQQHPDQLPFLSSFHFPARDTRSLIRISIDSNSSQTKQLNDILAHFTDSQVDVWRRWTQSCTATRNPKFGSTSASPQSQCIDLATTREVLQQIEQIAGLEFSVLLEDVHQTARQQTQRHPGAGSNDLEATKHKIFPPHKDPPPEDHPGEGNDAEWHNSYHTVEDLASRYPSLARVEEIGRTEENRPIEALVINTDPPASSSSTSSSRETYQGRRARTGGVRTGSAETRMTGFSQESSEKLGFVFVGELHAREWVSASTLLHFASDLLSLASADRVSSSNHRVFDDFEITVIPLGNPDGYAYTWEQDRFWRKNRQTNRDEDRVGDCKGINLGSNWGHAFQSSPIKDSCTESYSGSRAFEARETLAIRNYIDDKDKNIKGFIELHSYGQLLPDEEDLAEVSLGASRALRNIHGRTYQTGKACEITFPSSGSAIDYAYHSSPSKIKWAFSIELRDTGTYGFLLPPNQIKPTAEEFMAATRDLLDFVGKKEKK